MDLRLIALDLDGTTLNSQGKVSPYTKEILFFDTLPDFFEQIILKGEFYYQKFNLKDKNQLNCLVYNDSIKNTDNFKIVSKEKYDKIMN